MKKLLGSTLALALLVPASANAELLKNFKMGGSLEVDAVSATNVTDFNTATYDDVSSVQTRLMVKADWDLLDDVHAHIGLDKNNRTWGGTTGATGGASQSVTGIEGTVFVDESYVKIDKLFGALDTTIGRQFYGEAGDLVIYFGPKYQLYGMPITALDGGRFDWNGEKAGLTLLAAKVTGSALATNDGGNVDLYGVDVHVKPMDNLSGGAYVYNRTTVNSGTAGNNVVGNDYLYVAGLKGKLTAGGAWLKAEIAKDFGNNRAINGTGVYTTAANYTGWAGKADAGIKVDLSNLGALTGWGSFGMGSGGGTTNRNFTAIAGDYRPGSIWGRFPTSSALSNGLDNSTLNDRTITALGLKVTPSALSKLTVGLSAYDYRVTTAYGVPTANRGNKFLGREYDLDLTWAHSENVSVSAGAGDFQPGRAIIVGNVNNNLGAGASQGVASARLCYADLSVKF
jgi:hypothetical protein